MGTNYELRTIALDESGETFEPIHVGKSSAGWRFLFEAQEIDGVVLHTVRAWADFVHDKELEGWRLFDEYGERATFNEIRVLIDAKCDGQHENSGDGTWSDGNADFIHREFC